MSHLYFVAIVADEPVLSEVHEFKQYCFAHFNSGHALRSPAHITLYPPFRATDEQLEECSQALTEVCWKLKPFEVRVNGFDCFKPRVIFADPELSTEMKELQSRIAIRLNEVLQPRAVDRRPFHPHLTIAFRDLTKVNFHKAWEYFESKDYERTWISSEVCILIHGDEGWSVLRRFAFGVK